MKKHLSVRKTLTGIAAVAMAAAVLAGCSAGAEASKGLDAALDYAKAKVSDFAGNQKRTASLFTNEMYAKANAAALMITDKTTDEDFETIARYLSLDSITVADETKTIVASYPDGEKGKKLKELDGKKVFSNVVTNISFKQMTDPVYDEASGTYTVMAGVKRSDGTGVVIAEISTDEYADVCGSNLAEKCGPNVIIINDGAVISSTLSGVNSGAAQEDIGVSDEEIQSESFSLTADGQEYQCKAATAGNKMTGAYTIVCAQPK